jgi:hypothetical protein
MYKSDMKLCLSKYKNNSTTCDQGIYKIIRIGTALNFHVSRFLPNLRGQKFFCELKYEPCSFTERFCTFPFVNVFLFAEQ